MKEGKKHLSVMIDEKIYMMIRELALRKHGKIKGALSQEV